MVFLFALVRNKILRKNGNAGNSQSGQSLIETMVAIFVLVTGLISAVSLAIASFNATDNTNKQITATALAREAIEGVRNIRDQYWLNGTLSTCSDIGSTQQCYINWQGPAGGKKLVAGNYNVDYDTATSQWVINSSTQSSNHNLFYNSSTGLYSTQGSGGSSFFSRKVDIVETVAAPYTSNNPRLDITSTVWWKGRNCAATTDPSTLPASCKVVLTIYLTNWRNY